ncbi:peptide chain release factor N(5)-glutamine methyltransferase [Aureimonas altamirensis]|uniref:peptide chain release factor N(5)-glutamine methyltransferase n=1 Tax=Aureimonas altamirensis TaxID=370622 RepID=UPI0020370BAD|nr:peptide chain release factor N(5)-glutamine methyltransferase [Aureimonas altamirensis]MCM2504214.1 peptide chain release factor N(5)-glutamine methyltransferase [Aureimonas altamirensis]
MPEAPTIGELLAQARAQLAAAGIDSAAADARLLMMDSLGLTSADLHLRSGQCPSRPVEPFRERLLRRMSGEPVHRILGHRPFYAHDFALSADTLEPRPDTETLVDLAIETLSARFGRATPFLFADIGTGTGAIAVSLLAEFPQARCIAVDIAQGALDTAMRNARDAGVSARIRPLVSNYLSSISDPLDAVVSNPPYIPSNEIDGLDIGVRRHDPRRALDGGADGLDAYRALASGAADILRPAGDMLLEIGAGQGPDVRSLMEQAGLAFVASKMDLGGHERALLFRRGAG